MYVIARVSELSDLLGEQLNTLGAVTEDDRLVDLQLKRKLGVRENANKTIPCGREC